jgi:hypothetical protein
MKNLYHVWMLVFWAVDLGLATHLARLWSGGKCAHDFISYVCVPYARRDEYEFRRYSYNKYRRILVARAVLAAWEL